MSSQMDIANDVLKDVTIHTKTIGTQTHNETIKWVNVRDVALGPSGKVFQVEASTPEGLKAISEQDARFVNKHFGVKFILNTEEKEPKEEPNGNGSNANSGDTNGNTISTGDDAGGD